MSNILCRYRKKIKAIVKKKDCPVIQKCKKASLATLWCAASTSEWLSITGHIMNKHENPLFDGVRSWKAHQLRMVHQDTARTDIIHSLQNDSVLITQDFTMKFLPTQYREMQADFFGKRGISWHLTVCQSKQRGELVAQTPVQIVESGLQDSHIVVTVMEHVLKTLKQEHSKLTRVVFRQDNPGCYPCTNTILASKILRKRTNMDLYQIDFSDPQGGKGPCDRKAAQIKTHVKQYTIH